MQRWLRLTNHLPEFGIEPIVFTPEQPAFSLRDESLEASVAASTEVWKFPIFEPLKWLGNNGQPRQGQVLEKPDKSLMDRLLIWARATFFIPDPRVFWVRPSVRFLAPMLKSNGIDMVITTGPPHSMHLIGEALKQRCGIAWVADFRDPWSEWDILDKLGVKGWARARHRKLEQRVLQGADLLITVSRSWATDLERLGAKRTFVLTNGFDRQPEQEPVGRKEGKFVVAHVGMLNEMRNPAALWQALSELCVSNRQFAAALEIYLAGILSDQVVAEIQSFPELKDKLVLDGYLSHEGARRAMRQASVQLLIMNDSDNSKGHIPGKLFEYLEARRPVLAIGDPEGDAAEIVKKTGAGCCVSFGDKTKMKEELETRFRGFLDREVFSPKNIDDYSRRSLAMRLSNRLFQLMQTEKV